VLPSFCVADGPTAVTSNHHLRSPLQVACRSFQVVLLFIVHLQPATACWRCINALTTGINVTTSMMTIIPVTTSNHWHHQCNDPARPGSMTTSTIPAWQLNKTTLVNEATALVVVLNGLLVRHDALTARLHQHDPGDMAIELVVNDSGQRSNGPGSCIEWAILVLLALGQLWYRQ